MARHHWLLEHLVEDDGAAGSEIVLPINIGDDITARFSLENPSAVSEFIQGLANDIKVE